MKLYETVTLQSILSSYCSENIAICSPKSGKTQKLVGGQKMSILMEFAPWGEVRTFSCGGLSYHGGYFLGGGWYPSAHYGYRKGTLTNWKIVAFVFERACKARDLDRFLIHFGLEIIFWIFYFSFDKFSGLLENIKKETISEICWPIIFTFAFRTPSNICDGAFLRKLKTVSIFRKNM